jgi:hypothetical protein
MLPGAFITYPSFILEFGSKSIPGPERFGVYIHNSIFCATALGTNEGIIGVSMHSLILGMVEVFCAYRRAQL